MKIGFESSAATFESGVFPEKLSAYMNYLHPVSGIFQSRPNRFIAEVLVNGVPETVHVKNIGRCRELLIPGETVCLDRSDNPARRTVYDLVGVEKIRPGRMAEAKMPHLQEIILESV